MWRTVNESGVVWLGSRAPFPAKVWEPVCKVCGFVLVSQVLSGIYDIQDGPLADERPSKRVMCTDPQYTMPLPIHTPV